MDAEQSPPPYHQHNWLWNSSSLHEGISSPITAQILDFCDDGDIFSETLRNSEVSSCSGGGGGAGSGSAGICCYDDISLPSDFSPFTSMDASALSALLDSQPQPEPEPDIVLSGSYPSMQPTPLPLAAVYHASSYLSNSQDHFDATALSNINNPLNGYSSYSSDPLLSLSAAPPQLAPPSLPSVFDDDCMLSLSSYMGLDSSPASTSCSFMAPTIGGALYAGSMGGTASGEGLGFYPGSMVVGAESVMATQEVVVDYQGESGGCGGGMGFYAADSMTHQRIYGTSGDLQVSGDHPHLVNGCGSPTPLASDVASLDESTFKVGRLSVEERKEKIHRYMKKRNERNFTKKIKYACRKTLADSRPRVRGRFAKNDEFGEAMKPNSIHHDQDDEEEESQLCFSGKELGDAKYSSIVTVSLSLPIDAKTFAAVSAFYYGVDVAITPFNVAPLRIAAELLEMAEDETSG
ncbi:hypothetical protein Taro_027114 [Colocasia esculenta]|uniref:CCT domain-containing protein n=1 Tax=Colocasia esculenta TaxID=4460 RepID=A0A843VH51_COLES|nr:hypothetical protein [Colocasia esculenta]